MNVKGYSLVNTEKLDRALNGTPMDDSRTVGGVGGGAYFEEGVWKKEGSELSKKETDALEFSLLAEYDRIGGLIRKNGDKVQTGSFYNFKARAPHEKPRVVFVYKVNNRFVEVPEGTELPGEVKAAKILESKEEEEAEVEEKPKKRTRKSS